MQLTTIKYVKSYIIVFLSLFIFGGQPAEFGNEKAFFQGYPIKEPVIKIGLGVNLSDIKISSSSGMKIYEINRGYKLVAEDTDDVYIKGRKERLTEKFVIQVAQTKERIEAEILAQDLRAKIKNKVYVSENIENKITGTFQVKVGDFLTRNDALNFIKELNQVGMKDTWILREEIKKKESKILWILVDDQMISLSDEEVLYFIPSHPQSYLSFKEQDYRGIFVLRTTQKGIVLINILNIEDYLKGVVPSELSPYSFTAIEAHKAQAVAARTYAMRNLGLNGDLGFDLCDSPKSQFYRGMSAEHPLTSKAVELTKGEVALYKGQLINALYTSTCGGMTENVENIFEGPALPYLKSTECIYEEPNEWLLKSENLIRPIQLKGKNISPEIAYLISLNIIPRETDPDYYFKKASLEEANIWLKNVAVLLEEKNETISLNDSPSNFTSFAFPLIDSLEWENKAKTVLPENERDYVMKGFREIESETREHLAHFLQPGIFTFPDDLKEPTTSMTRGELVFYLGKIIQSLSDLSHKGVFKGIRREKIELEEDEGMKQLLLSPKVFLLRNTEGFNFFTSHVSLLGGELVSWVEREGVVQLLQIIYPPLSNLLDQSSTFRSWQLRVSREELERRINQYYPVGNLIDIIPQKKGDSKRVVELLIKGVEAQAVVKGFRIRRVLGLQETLFVIDREYDVRGNITHFNFFGRGLGHGVGLCQVGACGMAKAGADYKEILQKYYHGIKISKIY